MSMFTLRSRGARRALVAVVAALVAATGPGAAAPPAVALVPLTTGATTTHQGVLADPPARVLDTSVGRGAPAGPVASQQSRTATVAGASALPAQHWTGSALPRRQGSPTAVSCVAPSWCMSANEAGAVLALVGSTWSRRTQVIPQSGDQVRGFSDLSCPTTSFCLGTLTIGGHAVYRSGRWTVVSGPVTWRAVDCYSPTRCALVGEAYGLPRTGFWNGSTVGSVAVAAGFSGLRAVSCPTATLCWASGSGTGGQVRVTRASGATWRALDLAPSGATWVEVSCTSATFCLATSFDQNRAWRWNGTSWARVADTADGRIVYVDSLSCASPTSCQALGNGSVARWNGSRWSVTELTRYFTPSAGARNRVVDCASASMCLVVDAKGRYNRWNGATWSPMRTFDATLGVLGGLTCGSRTQCLLADSYGSVLRWNGTTWLGPTAISESRSLLSCVSSTWCLAVDAQSGTFRTWTGAWSPTRTFDTVNYYSDVACASRYACFLFQNGDYRRFNGTSWSALVPLFPDSDGSTAVRTVCATTSSCVAVDTFTGRFARWNGSSWSRPAPSGMTAVFALSCVSATSCGAVGLAGSPARDVFGRLDGSTWRRTLTPWGPTRLGCQTSNRCVATGSDDSTLWMWDGIAWGQTATRIRPASEIACRGTWCMATGTSGASWTG